MALDEPKQADEIVDRGAYRFLLDAQITDFVKGNGGLQIDYVDEPHQKGYVVKLANAPGGCSC